MQTRGTRYFTELSHLTSETCEVEIVAISPHSQMKNLKFQVVKLIFGKGKKIKFKTKFALWKIILLFYQAASGKPSLTTKNSTLGHHFRLLMFLPFLSFFLLFFCSQYLCLPRSLTNVYEHVLFPVDHKSSKRRNNIPCLPVAPYLARWSVYEVLNEYLLTILPNSCKAMTKQLYFLPEMD